MNDKTGEEFGQKLDYQREFWKLAWEELYRQIDDVTRRADDQIKQAQEHLLGYQKYCITEQMQAFDEYVRYTETHPPMSTGFKQLDEVLGGGLYEGLYAIGAVSSLGKTAFTLQIADQAAEQGHSAIIFSLEMSKFELIARSVSRFSARMDTSSGTTFAKSARGIMDGKKRLSYTHDEKALIAKAQQRYTQVADKRIYIWESDDDISLSMVHDTIETHIRHTGQRPLVIVDYLQILPHPVTSGYGTLSDKQAVDRNVTLLKRMSRKFHIPLLVVSSFNRGSYKNGAVMEAYKESGTIEYTADVLISLQYRGATTDETLAQARRKMPREIEAVILKNRNAQSWGEVGFRYNPALNLFTEEVRKA